MPDPRLERTRRIYDPVPIVIPTPVVVVPPPADLEAQIARGWEALRMACDHVFCQ
jgi:hypothetical protein